jgi:hypothetical protein
MIFIAPHRQLGDTVLAFACAGLMFGYFYSAFYQSYAFFEGKNFHLVKILVFRNTIPVMSVESLRHKSTFAGAFHGIEAVYKNDKGQTKRATIPVSAFGTKNVAAILHKFLEINPAIKVDDSTQNLMRKFS